MAKENHIKRILLNVNRNKKPKLAEWADNQENVTQSILWLIENWTSNTNSNEDLFAYLAKNYKSLSPSSNSSTVKAEKEDVEDTPTSKNDANLTHDIKKKKKTKSEAKADSSITEPLKIAVPGNMNYLRKHDN